MNPCVTAAYSGGLNLIFNGFTSSKISVPSLPKRNAASIKAILTEYIVGTSSVLAPELVAADDFSEKAPLVYSGPGSTRLHCHSSFFDQVHHRFGELALGTKTERLDRLGPEPV